MKISDAFRNAFRVYFGNIGASLKFLVVELCFTLAVLAPLLFLTAEGWVKWLALLSVPMFFGLLLWARVNAAGAMWDSLNGGSLFSMTLADTTAYGKKTAYGVKRFVMLLLWAAPLIACVVIARINMAGETDGFTVLRMIKRFGGGDLMTGMLYLILILVASILVFAFGCAFHSGDRHAFVREDPKRIKGHHGKIVLCWLCSLAATTAAAAKPPRPRHLPRRPRLLRLRPKLPSKRTMALTITPRATPPMRTAGPWRSGCMTVPSATTTPPSPGGPPSTPPRTCPRAA